MPCVLFCFCAACLYSLNSNNFTGIVRTAYSAKATQNIFDPWCPRVRATSFYRNPSCVSKARNDARFQPNGNVVLIANFLFCYTLTGSSKPATVAPDLLWSELFGLISYHTPVPWSWFPYSDMTVLTHPRRRRITQDIFRLSVGRLPVIVGLRHEHTNAQCWVHQAANEARRLSREKIEIIKSKVHFFGVPCSSCG